MAQIIALTQNRVAIVDDEDFRRLSRYKWQARWDGHNWYACTRVGARQVSMHRMIMGVTDSNTQVDHIDRNGLHNRKINLRVCTHAENLRNRRLFKNNTTGYRGVSLQKNKYMACIRVSGKLMRIGSFNSAEEAARAWDAAAREHHGDFAKLNFPD